MTKTYTELMSLPTFDERFRYLQESITHGVGDTTFGSLRYRNQRLYNSVFWKTIRAEVIIRDRGCDLAIPNRVITHQSLIRVHHINPLTPEMFDVDDPWAYDPENLITIMSNTHKMLTYGGNPPKRAELVDRRPYDHAPWRKE